MRDAKSKLRHTLAKPYPKRFGRIATNPNTPTPLTRWQTFYIIPSEPKALPRLMKTIENFNAVQYMREQRDKLSQKLWPMKRLTA